MENKEIRLTENQLQECKNQIAQEYSYHTDGCLCGYFEMYLKEIGYLTLFGSCHRSSGCPDGQSWNLDKEILVYKHSSEYYDTIGNEDKSDKEFIGYLNKEQMNLIREEGRKSIIKDYSYKGKTNEFGEDVSLELLDVNDKNLKFDDDVEIIWEEINKDFNMNNFLKGYVEINKFKLAIKKGLNEIE